MANTNEALVYGWSNQALGATAGQTGYAQPDTQAPVAAALASATQVSAGNPSPPGAMNVQGENSGSYTSQILENPGYATGNGTLLGVVTPPTMGATTVGIQSPYGLAAQVTVSGGTVTSISVAPNTAAGAGTYVQLETGDTPPNNQVLVPGGGWIKVSYTGSPTWTWTTTN